MYKSFLIVAISFLGLLVYGQNPVELQTDYLENPIGLDNHNPRLTWKIDDNRKGAKQDAYRLIVGVDSLLVNSVNGSTSLIVYKNDAESNNGSNDIIWDSGKIDSEVQLVTYIGANLNPFTKYYWKVIIWDQNKKESISDIQTFETG